MKRILMKQANFSLVTCGITIASVGLLLVSACPVAQASPQLGGDCHYCHSEEQPEALAITGFDEIIDDNKVFDVLPGGSVDLGIDVDNGQASDPAYRTVLRGLDRLNGIDEIGTPQGLPLLYTPDPTWDTKSSAPDNRQYLFWEGQFYGAPGGRVYDPTSNNFHLEISPDVEPGLYEVLAYVGGGFPVRAAGMTPVGGWNASETFQIRVVPEPTALALLLAGAALFGLGNWRRKRAAAVVLVIAACLLTANQGYAYPSRGGECAVCHSNPGPSLQTGDFDIKDKDDNTGFIFTVEAGDTTEFVFEFTRLLDNDPGPGEDFGRGYLVVDGLDLLNVDAGPPPAYEDIPYAASKYTVDNGQHDRWHVARGDHRYYGPTGQIYAQSSADPAASMPFPLELHEDVAPGLYALRAQLAGGRPSDPTHLDGWTVAKYFYLDVLAPSVAVPEPGTLLLLASALPMLWLSARRRGGQQA